jgi:hypothetical protein
MIPTITDLEIFTIGFMFSFGFYVAKDIYILIKECIKGIVE